MQDGPLDADLNGPQWLDAVVTALTGGCSRNRLLLEPW